MLLVSDNSQWDWWLFGELIEAPGVGLASTGQGRGLGVAVLGALGEVREPSVGLPAPSARVRTQPLL